MTTLIQINILKACIYMYVTARTLCMVSLFPVEMKKEQRDVS